MEKLLEINALNVSVSIKEKSGRTILSDVNIIINRGDFIFLKGNNGSGKSTFLNVLARYTPPQTSYYISGKSAYYGDNTRNSFDIFIPNVDMQWYKQQICYIEQTRIAKKLFSDIFMTLCPR
jgi:ABC-type cobalamin/Fe3+-siderophores transport system ATPase subunit